MFKLINDFLNRVFRKNKSKGFNVQEFCDQFNIREKKTLCQDIYNMINGEDCMSGAITLGIESMTPRDFYEKFDIGQLNSIIEVLKGIRAGNIFF